jgi:hypothetical protein
MSDKWKKAPIRITPDRAAIGHDTLVLADGPDTYQIDLEALFKTVPMESLYTNYRLGYRVQFDRAVLDRIEEAKRKDAKENKND